MKKLKRIPPSFKSEDEERAFWSQADSTQYVDWTKAKRVLFPNLRPSVKTISIRLPEWMIAELKALANKRDVPYQSLVKLFLAERLEEEFKPPRSRTQKR